MLPSFEYGTRFKGPKQTESDTHIDLFRSRLGNLADRIHGLVELAELIDFDVFGRD